MVSSVALCEAQEHLDELLDRAERGEEIVIERKGRTPMQLVPKPLGVSGMKTRPFEQNFLRVSYAAPDWDAPMAEAELAEWGM